MLTYHAIGGSGKVVEVDETYIGGYEKGAQGGKGKAIVLGMLEEDGDVITRIIPNRRTRSVLTPVADNVLKGSEIHTDELSAYGMLQDIHMDYTHKTVNHAKKQYVSRDGTTTNSIEGFFMHLKRTIKGTHIWVSAKHLSKYTGEAEFIYNRRNEPHRILNDLLYGYPKG